MSKLSNEYAQQVMIGMTYEAWRGGKKIASALVLEGSNVVITRQSDLQATIARRRNECTVYDLKSILCSRLNFATEGLSFRAISITPVAQGQGIVGGYCINRSHHLEILRQRDEFKAERDALQIVIQDMRAAEGDKSAYHCPQDGHFFLIDPARRDFNWLENHTTFDQAKVKAEGYAERIKRNVCIGRVMFEIKVERKTTYDVTSKEV